MEPSSILKTSHDISISGTKNSINNDNTKYKEIISTLPEEDCSWISHSLKFLKYLDFWCSQTNIEGTMSAQEHFIAQPTDIITCSYPKSGTTWLKALCFSILRRTHFLKSSTNLLLTQMPHDIVPVIEYSTRNNLPLWSTHIPYASLPKSIIESNFKIVYICRNPKDVLVSLRHFNARVKGTTSELPLEKTCQKFCEGVSVYGPYWNHVLGYWKASLQFPDRVFFIRYEDLQVHTLSNVKRLAEFMGYPFTAEEEKQGLVQQIIELCSFESLSNMELNKSNKQSSTFPIEVENNAFFRKGKIGDWENYLTPEMASQIDQVIEKKLSGPGLSFVGPT